MLEGGVIPRRPYLIVGPAGTGKSTLALQFLCEGVRRGERSLLVTIEEPPNEARLNHRGLGPEFERVEVFDAIPDVMRYERVPFKDISAVRAATPFHQVPLVIRRTPELTGVEVTITALEQMLRSEVTRRGYTRIVIDSLTALQYFCMKGFNEVAGAQTFLRFLSDLQVTTFLTVESPLEDVDTTERMLARGEVRLFRWELDGSTVRAIGVEKFRGGSHDVRLHPYRIGPNGIDINLAATISRDTRRIVVPVPIVTLVTPAESVFVGSPLDPMAEEVQDLVLIGAEVHEIRSEVEAALAAAEVDDPARCAHHIARATAVAMDLAGAYRERPPPDSAHRTPAMSEALMRVAARGDAVRAGVAPTTLPPSPALAQQLRIVLALLPSPLPPIAAPPPLAPLPEPPVPPAPVRESPSTETLPPTPTVEAHPPPPATLPSVPAEVGPTPETPTAGDIAAPAPTSTRGTAESVLEPTSDNTLDAGPEAPTPPAVLEGAPEPLAPAVVDDRGPDAPAPPPTVEIVPPAPPVMAPPGEHDVRAGDLPAPAPTTALPASAAPTVSVLDVASVPAPPPPAPISSTPRRAPQEPPALPSSLTVASHLATHPASTRGTPPPAEIVARELATGTVAPSPVRGAPPPLPTRSVAAERPPAIPVRAPEAPRPSPAREQPALATPPSVTGQARSAEAGPVGAAPGSPKRKVKRTARAGRKSPGATDSAPGGVSPAPRFDASMPPSLPTVAVPPTVAASPPIVGGEPAPDKVRRRNVRKRRAPTVISGTAGSIPAGGPGTGDVAPPPPPSEPPAQKEGEG